jgi:uncharacterized protein (TIGR02757 family)
VNNKELKEFLNEKAAYYDRPKFIENDPIQIPHLFSKKEDIEIAGFLVATIAWGNRRSIINNGRRIMDLMGQSPYDFVMDHSEKNIQPLSRFVHRTFNGGDLIYFIKALRYIYKQHNGLEAVFSRYAEKDRLQRSIHEFKKTFFDLPHSIRTEKHVSDPMKNSAAKRINMYLRWMVRPDDTGVDFGIWRSLSPSQLSCPLDVHTGITARKLGLIGRKQNDGKASLELDSRLRKFDPDDPVKYDFALFGLGVNEYF